MLGEGMSGSGKALRACPVDVVRAAAGAAGRGETLAPAASGASAHEAAGEAATGTGVEERAV